MSRRLVVGVFSPGLQGGVDEAVHYLFDAPAGRYFFRRYRTKGQHPVIAPLRFGAVVVRVVTARTLGRLDLAHIHVSVKGSTLRKIVLAYVFDSLGVPFLLQVHSGRYPAFWQQQHPWTQRIIARMFRRASLVGVLGADTAHFLVDHVGVDAARVVTIPNAVPIPQQPTRQLCTPPQPNDEPLIAYVGRLDENKGYRRLLQALSDCRELNWRAQFVGDGQLESAQTFVDNAELDERVKITAWGDRPTIEKLFQEADIFVLPSRSEGLALALLEAMSFGLACIATPVGAHPEVIQTEINGLFVAPDAPDDLNKALRRLLTNPALRVELGRNARQSVDTHFDVASTRQRVTELYDSFFVDEQSNQ